MEQPVPFSSTSDHQLPLMIQVISLPQIFCRKYQQTWEIFHGLQPTILLFFQIATAKSLQFFWPHYILVLNFLWGYIAKTCWMLKRQPPPHF